MERKEKKNGIGTLLVSALLAAELTILLDTVSVFCGRALSVPKFAALFCALFAAVFFLPFVTRKIRKIVALAVTCLVYVPLVIGVLCWNGVSNSVVYTAVDNGKAELYSGRSVMLLIPHQDDDINVLGGVIEEYRKYGSDVTVVFSTNGDYYGLAKERFREAINALEAMGVPEENVIFLGYGDQWDPEGPHIYNGEPGTVITSYHGKQETYGTDVKSVYREGAAYTLDNFLLDIENVILEYRPDILYCVDYDYNIDHRALTMSFDKVMGKILRDQEDYRPLVYKGYAYNSAWEAAQDFYEENLLATQNVFDEKYPQVPEIYRWEERIRLPVHGESLSRSVISSEAQRVLAMYESQGANMYGVRIFNSDKVFWQRYTTSLSYQAEIRTSSGQGQLLNDFMLLESHDLLNRGDTPHDGVWIPEAADEKKQVTVTFASPEDIHSVVLYDHPGETDNVLQAQILFDDGTSLKTGPLDPGGAATRILVEKTGVTSFVVEILEGQGNAGLTELEVYGEVPPEEMRFIKIMDEAENFVYDYWIDASGRQSFRLYSSGMEDQEYVLSCDNDRCSVVWHNGQILVECPVGEGCVVTVTGEDGSVSDSVYIQNPAGFRRAWRMFWLRAEGKVMELCEEKRLHERIFVWRMCNKIPQKLQQILS